MAPRITAATARTTRTMPSSQAVNFKHSTDQVFKAPAVLDSVFLVQASAANPSVPGPNLLQRSGVRGKARATLDLPPTRRVERTRSFRLEQYSSWV